MLPSPQISESAPAGQPHRQGTRRHVVLRSLLAILAAYALAWVGAGVFAVALPLPRGDAVRAAIMLGFLLQLGGAIWAYTARTLAHAVIGFVLPLSLLAVWGHILGAWSTP